MTNLWSPSRANGTPQPLHRSGSRRGCRGQGEGAGEGGFQLACLGATTISEVACPIFWAWTVYLYRQQQKLDRVGPIDNRPSTNL